MVGLKVSDTPEVLLDASRDKELYAQTGSTAPKSTGSVDLSDSDSSDDDAPEEEGLSAGKDEMEKQVKEREQAIKREQDLLKEKRRKQNLKFAEQQEQKRSRELEEQKKRQTDEDLLTATESKELELPEELPDEFFDSLDEAEPAFVAAKPTYVNFNEIDGNYAQEVVQELKKKKKKTLQQLRKKTLKRGPVTVSLLSSLKDQKSLAPKKEDQVTRSKDKWLKRKSLKRK